MMQDARTKKTVTDTDARNIHDVLSGLTISAALGTADKLMCRPCCTLTDLCFTGDFAF
jgi:hypothetical protein